MVVRLYGSPSSTATCLAALTLVEKEVPFEFVHIDLSKGEHKKPEYLEKHPFGQVPILDDDGFMVYESRAIARYVVEKYAGQGTQGLIPTDLKAKALFEQAASVEAFDYHPFVDKAFREVVVKPIQGLIPDTEVYDETMTTLAAKLAAYDVILGKQRFLGGNEVTLADLFHLPFGSVLASYGSNVFDSRPNVARWWKEISSRPAWLSVKDGAKSTL